MKLAFYGGSPIQLNCYDSWPVFTGCEEKAISGVLQSKRWGGGREGSEVQKFECEFAQYNNVKHAIAVSNGTSALIVALQALGIGKNDEVIVPAMSFIATATAVSLIGGIPVFVDIDPYTHCISPEQIRKAITIKTKAVIAVHIGGASCDMPAIVSIAREFGVFVIEDAAQAHGAEWNGQKVGTFGDVGVFSFSETKNMSCGEGGALITNNDEVSDKMLCLRNHGRKSGMRYFHPMLGWNFRITEFQATILRCQLLRLGEQLKRKNVNVEKIQSELVKLNVNWISLVSKRQENNVHAYYSLAFRFRSRFLNGISKSKLTQIINAEGIPCASPEIAPGPMYANPIFTEKNSDIYCENRMLACPVAEEAYHELVILGQPINSALLLASESEIQKIVDCIQKIELCRNSVID